MAIGALGVAMLLWPHAANAGAPGPTESLGKSKGLEFVAATYSNVASHTSQEASCPGEREPIGGGAAFSGSANDARLHQLYAAPISDSLGSGESQPVRRDEKPHLLCDLHQAGPPVQEQRPVRADPWRFGGRDGCLQSARRADFLRRLDHQQFCRRLDLDIALQRRGLEHDDRQWGNDIATEATAYATCAAGFDLRYPKVSKAGVPAQATAKLIAKCKQSEVVTGGGFNGPFGMYPSVSAPWDSNDKGEVPDDGWILKARNGFEAGRFTTHAICSG